MKVLKDLLTILKTAIDDNATDIMIVAGIPASYKKKGIIVRIDEEVLMPNDTKTLIDELYVLAKRKDLIDRFLDLGDDDFSFALPGLSRFRVNTYLQRGSESAVIRAIKFGIPDAAEMAIPNEVIKLADLNNGMVLITGPAANGKSTTLACIIDRINKTRQAHIITLEDPIEYIHKHDKSIVSQREIPLDTKSYNTALRAALRQSPDVILLGEMRDYDSMRTAIMASETGHYLLSTLHTVSASNTISRIIDAFPVEQQDQIKIQLSMVLRAVVCQQLIRGLDGVVYPVFEIMKMNSAIRNLIRESKLHQLDMVISTSANEGMILMDNSIFNLYLQKKIDEETAIQYANNKEMLIKKIRPGIKM